MKFNSAICLRKVITIGLTEEDIQVEKQKRGIYPKEEAIEDAKFCEDIHVLPVDIRMHNFEINQMIESLQRNLIPESLSITETTVTTINSKD